MKPRLLGGFTTKTRLGEPVRLERYAKRLEDRHITPPDDAQINKIERGKRSGRLPQSPIWSSKAGR